jgi:hypothetical protein
MGSVTTRAFRMGITPAGKEFARGAGHEGCSQWVQNLGGSGIVTLPECHVFSGRRVVVVCGCGKTVPGS